MKLRSLALTIVSLVALGTKIGGQILVFDAATPADVPQMRNEWLDCANVSVPSFMVDFENEELCSNIHEKVYPGGCSPEEHVFYTVA